MTWSKDCTVDPVRQQRYPLQHNSAPILNTHCSKTDIIFWILSPHNCQKAHGLQLCHIHIIASWLYSSLKVYKAGNKRRHTLIHMHTHREREREYYIRMQFRKCRWSDDTWCVSVVLYLWPVWFLIQLKWKLQFLHLYPPDSTLFLLIDVLGRKQTCIFLKRFT